MDPYKVPLKAFKELSAITWLTLVVFSLIPPVGKRVERKDSVEYFPGLFGQAEARVKHRRSPKKKGQGTFLGTSLGENDLLNT